MWYSEFLSLVFGFSVLKLFGPVGISYGEGRLGTQARFYCLPPKAQSTPLVETNQLRGNLAQLTA